MKKNSLKKGLLFSAAVASSIFGYYRRAYSACDSSTAGSGAVTVTCDLDAGDEIFTHNNSIDPTDNSIPLTINNTIALDGGNLVQGSSTITIGDGTGGANQVNIVSTENSGILIVGGELDLPKNKNSAVDLDFTLEKNVNIQATASDHGSDYYDSRNNSGVTFVNYSGHGSSTVTINGDVSLNQSDETPNNGTISAAVMISEYSRADTQNSPVTTPTASVVIGKDSTLSGLGDGAAGLIVNGFNEGDVSVEINGDISSANQSAAIFNGAGFDINIGAQSTIAAIEDDAVKISLFNKYAGDANLTISGADISSTNGSAISLDANSSSTNTNTTRNNIITITEAELSGNNVIDIKRATKVTINFNESIATGNAGSSAIQLNSADDVLNIAGVSAITGDVSGGGGADTLNLGSGTGANLTLIHSDVTGFETIINKENSILTLHYSSITGSITSDAGNTLALTLNNSSLDGDGAAAVAFGDANDSLTITGTSSITGDVSGGGGIDTLNLGFAGYGANLTLTSSDVTGFETIINNGNSILTLSNSSIIGSITSNAYNTLALTLNDSSLDGDGAAAVAFGDANDSLTITGNSSITGNVSGGAGTDTLNLGSGTGANLTLTSSVVTGFETIINKGDSVLTLNASSITGSITSDAYNTLALTLSNYSYLNGNGAAAVTFGDANDSLTIIGTSLIIGDVSGGGGADILNLGFYGIDSNLTLNRSYVTGFETIINKENSALTLNISSITGSITSDTDNTLALTLNNSSLDGDGAAAVTFGDANDILTISGTSSIIGNVSGGAGAGTDTLNLGSGTGANLTLIGSEVTGFETIINKENSILTLDGSSITGSITSDTDNTLDLILFNYSSLNGNGDAAVTFGDANDSLTIFGTSSIEGNVSGGGGTDTLNLGYDVDGYSSNLTVTNSNVTGFETIINKGDSVLTLNASSITGSITSDADNTLALTLNDSSLNRDGAAAVTFGGVNDSLTITGTSSITGNVSGGAGTDTLSLGFTGNGANLTVTNSNVTGFETIINKENSTATLNNSSITGSITSDAYNTLALTLNNSSLDGDGAAAVAFGDANDSLTITGTSSITGDVSGGAGTDTLNLNDATLTLTAGSDITGFENFNITGTSQINGNFNVEGGNFTIEGGALSVVGGIQGVNGGAINLILDGEQAQASLIAANGTAANFANQDDSVTVKGDVIIQGLLNGGTGNNSLVLNNTDLTLSALGIGQAQFDNFDSVNIVGTNTSNRGFAVASTQGIIFDSQAQSSLTVGNEAGIAAVFIQNAVAGEINAVISGSIVNNSDGVGLFLQQGANENVNFALNNSGNISSVNGDGVVILNNGNGVVTANISGSISSGDETNSLFVRSTDSTSIVNLTNGADLSGKIAFDAEDNSAVNLTMNGQTAAVNLVGLGGTAIDLSNEDDTINIQNTVNINGDIDAKGGNDTLNINNSTLTISQGSDIVKNIENVNFVGNNSISGNIDLTGKNADFSNSINLKINGNVTLDNLSVGNQMIFSGNNTLTTDLIIADGGTIAPGNSVGTINVVGNVIFETGSKFDVEVDGNTADKIVATGNITIENGVNLDVTPLNNSTSGSATILEAALIDGNFDTVTFNGNGNVTTLYKTDNATIKYTNLNNSNISSQIQATVDSAILFNDTLNEQISRQAFNNDRNFWVRNIYRAKNVDSSGSNVGFDQNAYGLAFGAEKMIDNQFKVGGAFGYIDSSLDFDSGQGRSDSESYYLSVYANYKNADDIFTSLALSYGYHNNDNSRSVANNGVSSFAKSSNNDNDFSANLQIAKKFNFKNVWNILPKLSASYIKTYAGKINESSGGDSAVEISSYSFATLKFREAVRFERESAFKVKNIEFSPYFELGLAQERGVGDRNVSGSFKVNNSNFSTKLRSNNRNFFTGNLGFNMKVSESINAFVSYENATSSQEVRNDFNAGLSIKF